MVKKIVKKIDSAKEIQTVENIYRQWKKYRFGEKKQTQLKTVKKTILDKNIQIVVQKSEKKQWKNIVKKYIVKNIQSRKKIQSEKKINS